MLPAIRSITILFFAITCSLWLNLPADAEDVPLPRLKPHADSNERPGAVPLPRQKPARRQTEAAAAEVSWPEASVRRAEAQCAELASASGVTWQRQPPLGSSGACGTAVPIIVTAAAGIAIEPPALVNCRMAKALADWLARDVQPIAAAELGSPVVKIRNAASYVCRSRNNRPGAKMSEHASANALDISAFVLADGREAEVGAGAGGSLDIAAVSAEDRFLRQVRLSACGPFRTVLGPGSDPEHATHFHVDLARRRNGSTWCK